MKYFTFFLIVLFFSCQSNNSDQIKYLPNDSVLLSSKKGDESINELMKYTGVEHLRSVELTFNTDNTHYFPFAAVYFWGNMINGKLDQKEAELISFKSFDGCFFNKAIRYPDSVFYSQEKLTYDVMVDRRINDILHNDSLYFSLDGRWHAVGVPGSISSYSISDEFEKIYSADGPMPLFRASFNIAGKDKAHEAILTFGLISYQCQDKIDWDAYIESSEFTSFLLNLHDFEEFEYGKLDYKKYIAEK